MNPYEILGVDKQATRSQIKTAYYQLAEQHHPDKGGNAEVMKQITHAYAILSSPTKRKYYDKYGREEDSVDDKAFEFLSKLIIEAFLKSDRPIASIYNHLDKETKQLNASKEACKELHTNLTKRIKKFKEKNKKATHGSTILEILDCELIRLSRDLEKHDKALEDLNKVKDMLQDIEEPSSMGHDEAMSAMEQMLKYMDKQNATSR